MKNDSKKINDAKKASVPHLPPTLPPPEEAPAPAPGLPSEIETALDRKQAVLRDVVSAVADGGLLGMYAYGRAGTGKSYLVRDELERREARYIFTSGHITAKGLFQ